MRLMPAVTMMFTSICLATIGCGPGADPNRRETAPVTVTVTLDGKPFPEGRVIFIAAQDPVPAAGITNAEGVAKLTTYESEDGAVLGQHNVQILKVEAATAAAADQNTPEYDPNAVATTVKTKSLVPAKYTNAGTSGFTADVKKGPNSFTFEMKSK